jgi:hypothetical protein
MKKVFYIGIPAVILFIVFVIFMIRSATDINYKTQFGVNKQLLFLFKDSTLKKMDTLFCSSHVSEKRAYSSFFVKPNIVVSVFELNDAPLTKSLDSVDVVYLSNDSENPPKIVFNGNNDQPKELSEDFLFTDNLSVFIGEESQTRKIKRTQKTIIVLGNHKQISLCDNGKVLFRVKYKRKNKSNLFIINNFKNKLMLILVYSEEDFDELILNLFQSNVFDEQLILQ